MIQASILADSINPAGVRLTTWKLTYPRFIHAEFMTHRVFSRNAASSRAIPLKRMIEAVFDEPAWPAKWGSEQKGMQCGNTIPETEQTFCEHTLLDHLYEMINVVELLHKEVGIHKSILNRYLEPWAHITVLATATDHANFFALRAHPAAEPTFQVLAYRMLDKYLSHSPTRLAWNEWHIPHFGGEGTGESIETTLKIATARCARISYLTHDGIHDPAADIALHDRLAENGHWSPFEHCAKATPGIEMDPRLGSNFDTAELWSGWVQYRKHFKAERRTASLPELLAAKPDWITLQ